MDTPVVIVGGGTAGCTMASHLAAHTQRRIVVCEPGRLSIHDDHPGFFDVIADANLVSAERVGLTRQNETETYLQARAVGGGSAVNAMLLTGAEPNHLRGLTQLAEEGHMGDVARALMASGGEPCRLWWNGGRWNPGRAVAHLVDEGRVELRRGTVSQIEIDNRQVTAVWCNDERIATDTVVLTAGALESPRLLMRSGCTDMVDGIGDGVQDHPCITFVLPLKSLNKRVFDASVVKRIELQSGAQGLLIGYERASATDTENGLLSVLLMNPRSTGRISASGEVMLNLLGDDDDTAAMVALVRHACEVVLSEPFASVCHMAIGDRVGTRAKDIVAMSDAEMAEWMKGALAPVSHVSASLSRCVDSAGRINGVSGLVVADASVLPRVPHETPAAPVTMEALRIARALGEELK